MCPAPVRSHGSLKPANQRVHGSHPCPDACDHQPRRASETASSCFPGGARKATTRATMPRTMKMPENRTAITPYLVGVGRFVGSRNGSNRFLADPPLAHRDRLPTRYSVLFPAALAFAHLALADSARRLRTAALTFRLGLATTLDALVPRCFAHRAR